MRVVEKFVSIEGEGKRTGVLCSFIRLAGCNLRCSYCDTKYGQLSTDGKEELVMNIVEWAEEQNVKCVTVTGGEPLMHEGIDRLLYELVRKGFLVNVETNGSVNIEEEREKVYTHWFNAMGCTFPRSNLFFTVDYKCPSSLMEREMCGVNFNSYALSHDDCVKFVVGSMEDLIVARDIYQKMGKGIKCYISPVWGKIEMKTIVEFMIAHKHIFSTNARIQIQLHKVIWDPAKRGV